MTPLAVFIAVLGMSLVEHVNLIASNTVCEAGDTNAAVVQNDVRAALANTDYGYTEHELHRLTGHSPTCVDGALYHLQKAGDATRRDTGIGEDVWRLTAEGERQ